MIIIFAGALGRFPVGGHAWTEMQYLLTLRSLGHDVFFLEECGQVRGYTITKLKKSQLI